MAMSVAKQWTRVRTLGRGASGAEVFLAADDASGELFAVKSAAGATCAAALRREQCVMAGLSSPRVVSCIGGRCARDGSYQLFLEFAPGGSLADQLASGLDERAVRGYAADVADGLAYLHGAGMVHGDVKARNVVIGVDGRAKLADFGCAREAGTAGGPIIGGTPAFMAPEVARGEEQGPAADVWALGCMVVEMATGRAPWSGMDGDALAALHRIGYTEAVPEVPQWLPADAKDFLARCLVRQASDRCTAAKLLEHPFLAAAVVEAKQQAVESKWVSPKSTLDAAFWESESDTDEAEHESTAEMRIRSLACPASALPHWECDDGWIDVLAAPTEAPDVAPVAAEEMTDLDDGAITNEEPSGAESRVLPVTLDGANSVLAQALCLACDDSIRHQQSLECLASHESSCKLLLCDRKTNANDLVLAQALCFRTRHLRLGGRNLHATSPVYGRKSRVNSQACRPRRTPRLPPRKGWSRRGKRGVAEAHALETIETILEKVYYYPAASKKPLVGLRGASRVDEPTSESETFSTSERRIQRLLRQVEIHPAMSHDRPPPPASPRRCPTHSVGSSCTSGSRVSAACWRT